MQVGCWRRILGMSWGLKLRDDSLSIGDATAFRCRVLVETIGKQSWKEVFCFCLVIFLANCYRNL